MCEEIKIDDEPLASIEHGCHQRGLTCDLKQRGRRQTLVFTDSQGRTVKFVADRGTRNSGHATDGRRRIPASVWGAMNSLWFKNVEQ